MCMVCRHLILASSARDAQITSGTVPLNVAEITTWKHTPAPGVHHCYCEVAHSCGERGAGQAMAPGAKKQHPDPCQAGRSSPLALSLGNGMLSSVDCWQHSLSSLIYCLSFIRSSCILGLWVWPQGLPWNTNWGLFILTPVLLLYATLRLISLIPQPSVAAAKCWGKMHGNEEGGHSFHYAA